MSHDSPAPSPSRQDTGAAIDHWGSLLGCDPTELPLDRRRGGPGTGPRARVPLPFDRTAGPWSTGPAGSAPHPVDELLLAALTVLAVRYTGRPETVVGVRTAGRTVAVRVAADDDTTFAGVLESAARGLRDSRAHFPVPDAMQEQYRDRCMSLPLFRVLLDVGEDPGPGDRSDADLVLRVMATGGSAPVITGVLEYRTDLFDSATAERLASHVVRVLRAATERSAEPIGRLPLLTAAESRRLVNEWGRSASEPPLSGCFDRIFRDRVRRTPDAPAVTDARGTVSYRELDRAAEALAGRIRALAPRTEHSEIVAVALPRGLSFVTAMLAVFRAGHAFVLLDRRQSETQSARVLEQSATPLVITAGEESGNLGRIFGTMAPEHRPRVLMADEECSDAEAPGGVTGTAPCCSPDDLAYVMFTSGSTGAPKGTMVEQRGMVNHIGGKVHDLGLTAADTVAQIGPPSFDIVVWQCLAALAVGGRVEVIGDETLAEPADLLAHVARSRVTVLQVVPALMRSLLLVASLDHVPLPDLRWIVPTGDALPTDVCAEWFARYPGIPVLNTYGSTECSDDQCHYRLDSIGDDLPAVVPIGRPIPGISVYVLDRCGEPVPVGVPGELYIGGIGVGRGYLGRPDLTERHFVDDPFGGCDGRRLYRTGDRARWRADGVLEFLGRLDSTVKIRGFRIEVDQIEETLRSSSAVHDCVVAPHGDGTDRILVAHVVLRPEREESADAGGLLRAHLTERLPAHMVPAVFRFLPELPVNRSGKVDRKKLLPAVVDPGAGSSTAPHGDGDPLESKVLAVWRDVLPVGPAGAEDDFIALGGHSLLAVEVAVRLRPLCGLRVTAGDTLRHRTVRGFVAALRAGLVGTDGPETSVAAVVPRPEQPDEPFALTALQEAYWVGQLDHFELGGLHAHLATRISWPGFDVVSAERSINALVARHDVLRTVVTEDGTQRVLPGAPPYRLDVVDARGWEAARAEEELGRLQAEFARTGPDPARWPAFDVRVHRLADDDYAVSARISLLLLDAHSEAALAREFLELYHGRDAAAREPGAGYRDHMVALKEAEASPAFERAAAYWRDRFPLPGPPELPLAVEPANAPSRSFVRHRFTLDKALWSRLKERAAARGLTPSGVVCAAFAEVIARWSKNEHFCLNVLTSMRHRTAGGSGPLGNFGSTVPLEVNRVPGTDFADRAVTLQNRLWDDLEHARFSAVHLAREAARGTGWTTRTALPVVFASTLDVDNGWQESLAPGVTEVAGALQTPQVYLDHQIYEYGGALVANWDVLEGMFPAGLVEEALSCYRDLLGALATDDRAWRGEPGTPSPSAPDASEPLKLDERGLLHTSFFGQAGVHPERIAIVTDERTLSYGELARYAEAVAEWLVEAGVARGAPVPVVMEKGWEQVAAVLGVLLAGAAYVPVDAALPAARIAHLVERSAGRVVLTQSWVRLDGLEALGTRRLRVDRIRVREVPGECAGILDRFGDRGTGPDDLAYVIYTSGSTGLPKGVAIDHRGATNTVADINARFGVGPDDRVLALSSLSFDLSVFDIFGLLAVGGAVVLPGGHELREPSVWSGLMARHGVTIWNSVPALMNMLVEHLGGESPGVRPRLVMLSGDWIPTTLPAGIRRVLAPEDLVSLGGATEASIWSIAYPIGEVDPLWRSIPYGKALTGQSVRVLDSAMEPKPHWATGEIYIGGIGVARGYWGDDQRTAERFVRHPRTGERLYRTGDLGRLLPDGAIEFCGREDSQVKVQGYRIELGEIETALLHHPGVRDAAVVPVDTAAGGRSLAAYVVPAPDHGATGRELRDDLAARLPSYMVPAYFVMLDALPLTVNGKVDRSALPSPRAEGSAGRRPAAARRPADDVEARLTACWAAVLETEVEGVDEDFFALGGNSFAAIRLMARIREQFGVSLPLAALFEAATPRLLADVIRGTGTDREGTSLVAIRRGGSLPPLFLVHPVGGNVLCYGEFARMLGPDQPVFGLSARGLVPGAAPHRSIEEMARDYLDEVLKECPDGSVRLGGWSMGGVVALEMARLLDEAGFVPRPVLMIDSGLPTGPGPVDDTDLVAAFIGDLLGSHGVPARSPGRSPSWLSHGVARTVRENFARFDLDDAQIDQLFTVFRLNTLALRAYRPVPSDIGVVLVRATEGPRDMSSAEDMSWDGVAGSVEEHRILADHYSILARPALGELTALARRELGEARTAARSV